MNGSPGFLTAIRRSTGQSFGRSRWVALGALLAVVLGAGGNAALALVSSGDKGVFVDVTPTRIADTRFDIGITNALSSGTSKQLKVTGNVPIAPSGTATVVPGGALGVVLNVTAVNPTRAGYISVRPGNPAGVPSTSSLNVVAGVTVPNAVTVGLPTSGANDGKIQIWYQASGGSGTTHVLVDVVGYYDNHNHDDRYYTKAQTRNLISDHMTFGGTIQSDGTKRDSGPYTSNRSGPGVYSIAYDTTGLGILPDQMPPNVTATPDWVGCATGSTVQAGWSSYSTFNGELTGFSILVSTYNLAGVAADCRFQFHIIYDAPTTLILSPDSAAPNAPSSEFPANKHIECTSEASGTVCKPLD